MNTGPGSFKRVRGEAGYPVGEIPGSVRMTQFGQNILCVITHALEIVLTPPLCSCWQSVSERAESVGL